jgi:hypothetical protein
MPSTNKIASIYYARTTKVDTVSEATVLTLIPPPPFSVQLRKNLPCTWPRVTGSSPSTTTTATLKRSRSRCLPRGNSERAVPGDAREESRDYASWDGANASQDSEGKIVVKVRMNDSFFY